MGRPSAAHGHNPLGTESLLVATPYVPDAVVAWSEHEVETVTGTDALVADRVPMRVRHGDKQAALRAVRASRAAANRCTPREVRNDAPDKLTPRRRNPAGPHGRVSVMRATTTGHDEGGTSYRHSHA
jgi:hypothetical protein